MVTHLIYLNLFDAEFLRAYTATCIVLCLTKTIFMCKVKCNETQHRKVKLLQNAEKSKQFGMTSITTLAEYRIVDVGGKKDTALVFNTCW